MYDFAQLTLNAQLELSVQVGFDTTKSFTMSLSRIMAQRLADELHSFASNRKAIDGRRELTFAAEVLPPRTASQQGSKRSVLRLDGPSSKAHPGVLYLGTPSTKKAGVLYLDDKPARKRPVIRLDNPKR